jgi:LPPG:FO 2-phospho-L-lactate transferase
MRVVLLAGGTGGAKMAHGFQQVLEPGELTVIVNVGDDTEQFGLLVCPDLDTVLYTLSGLADADQGWGVAGDTFTALGMLERLGVDTWFRIGDADLAIHIRRRQLMAGGASLTDATARLAAALGVPTRILPASDEPIRTRIGIDDGELDFQDYFVRRRQADEVRAVRFAGIEEARPATGVLAALREADLLVIGPSNPLVSIGPILSIPGIRDAVAAAPGLRVAVSGIIAGQAIRGPADRMLGSLGHEATARGVARLYEGLADRFVIDEADRELGPSIEQLGMAVDVLPTVMRTDADRAALAEELVALATRSG